jgi:Fe-S-cluster containining protein
MKCRSGCGACCIAPSMSSAIPGMPAGKPAGIRCAQLTADLRCALFGLTARPSCCSGLQASEEMCGNTREEALDRLDRLEVSTRGCSAGQ